MIRPVRWKQRHALLAPEEVEALHGASLRVLEETGVHAPLSPARLEQLADLGVRVDREAGRLRFPPELVERAVARAPGAYRLHARSGDELLLDGSAGHLCLDGSAAVLLDGASGETRPSTRADLERAVRLADALPQLSLLWPCVSAGDQPAAVQPLHELEVLLTCSSKHAQAMTVVDPETARDAVAMAAEVAGGREALRARPLLSSFQCSVSPLAYEPAALEAAVVFAEAGVPCGFWSMTIGGGTAPVTPAGNAALASAEILAGVVVLELLCPGAPTFYGTSATMMELRRGGVACGGPEDTWLQAAGCQLAHRHGLPAAIGTYAAGAKSSGWQAGVENAASALVSQLVGAELMPGAGLLHSARVFSEEQLLLDCELHDLLRSFLEGYPVDAEALAVETIAAVGPQGHFLGEAHTLAHMREVWQPKLLDRGSWEEWTAQGRPGAAARARAEAARLLARHEVAPLPCAPVLRELVREAERRRGLG